MHLLFTQMHLLIDGSGEGQYVIIWLPYSSHTSHHPSQTPCLPWISYATQKLMLNSCKMLQKQSEAFDTFRWHFSQVQNRILLHIVLIKCSHVQIAFLKFTSYDNQALVGCIPITAVGCSFKPEIIKIGQSSHNMYSNKILNFQESTTILKACTKSLETYWRHHVAPERVLSMGQIERFEN